MAEETVKRVTGVGINPLLLSMSNVLTNTALPRVNNPIDAPTIASLPIQHNRNQLYHQAAVPNIPTSPSHQQRLDNSYPGNRQIPLVGNSQNVNSSIGIQSDVGGKFPEVTPIRPTTGVGGQGMGPHGSLPVWDHEVHHAVG